MSYIIENIKEDWKEKHIESIYKKSNTKIYHYTTLENVWNILESDLLFARHVRFSNDSEEYDLGKKYLEELLNKPFANIDNCYMICFCEKGNILSQWREYARGGVSLEFDFSTVEYYTINCNQYTIENNRKKEIAMEQAQYFFPGTMYSEKKDYYYMYAEPIKVKYVQKKEDLQKDYQVIKNITHSNKEMLIDRYMKPLIPYIKHSGFREEKEVRLIFTPEYGFPQFYMDYLNEKGFHKPYIKVEFGLAEKKFENNCEILYSDLPKELENVLSEQLKYHNWKLTFHDEKEDIDIIVTFTKRINIKKDRIFLGNCKHQDVVFDFLAHFVRYHNANWKRKVKIWCEGHLPIRRIIVGPVENRHEIKESIEQKIKSIYWLEYVDVEVSDIPYRQKA